MTPKDVLVVNCGSSSLKLAILNVDSGARTLSGAAERLVHGDSTLSFRLGDGSANDLALGPDADHAKAMRALVEIVHEQGLDNSLVAVGHRVVHGGEDYSVSVVIDDGVINKIRANAHLAPLHNPANIVGIEAARIAFPGLPQVAVFDTAFHQSMPRHAYLYALPYSLYSEHGVRRYGMHGSSHLFVARRAAETLGTPLTDTNLITAHLGNGASVAALRGGRSVDTSMGLTPLEGLIMGTRCGDLDPSMTSYLVEQLGFSNGAVNEMYNNESGLLGISGLSNDCRNLEAAAANGNARAALALDMFCYRLAKYIASYLVAVGRLDALVLTGGIGENSAFVRDKLLGLLEPLGFELDETANEAARFGESGIISTSSSRVAMVIPTNEEWLIAQDAADLAGSL